MYSTTTAPPRFSHYNNTILYCIVMNGVPSTAGRHRGRARDPGIDTRVLAVAHRHLSALGYEAMSVAAVAQEAGTTRQALYRRGPGQARPAPPAPEAPADPRPAGAPQ